MQNKTQTRLSVLFVLMFLISSCSALAPEATPTPAFTETPTATQTPASTATFTPTPTLVPAPARATYTLNTTMDYDAHTVVVDETIVYPNHTGAQLNALALAVV